MEPGVVGGFCIAALTCVILYLVMVFLTWLMNAQRRLGNWIEEGGFFSARNWAIPLWMIMAIISIIPYIISFLLIFLYAEKALKRNRR